MKNKISILFILLFTSCFSQIKFEKTPENVKKIHFVYEKKANIFFDDKGFYADTLLYKYNFPNLKFIKVNHPKENYICGYVPFKTLDIENNNKFIGFMYHNFEIYKGVYTVKKNETTITAERNDENIKKLFKEVFQETYRRFDYKIKINYNKEKKTTNYPNVIYKKEFSEIQKSIIWETSVDGVFKELINNILYTNIVDLNENLSKYITLGYVFENNNFGVTKVTTIFETIELKAVYYE